MPAPSVSSASPAPSALPDLIRSDVDLTPFNTLALPCRAAFFATLSSLQQLDALAASPVFTLPRFILGGGSNLVLPETFDGLIVRIELPGRVLAGEDADAWYVRAGAGENWDALVRWTLRQGWPGLENLTAIPGTAGAAPIQNIGAYGAEIGEFIHEIVTFDLATPTQQPATRRLSAQECRFAYRDSRFKQEGMHCNGHFLISEITLRLPKRWQARTRYAGIAEELERLTIAAPGAPSASDIARAVENIRRRKLPDPNTLPNAGSFFQNPLVDADTATHLQTLHPTLPAYEQADGRKKLAAGWLIEQAGWKGRRLGPAGMHENQALVLVNHGGAARRDIEALAAAVIRDVKNKFGVTLIQEPIHVHA